MDAGEHIDNDTSAGNNLTAPKLSNARAAKRELVIQIRPPAVNNSCRPASNRFTF
jgi:hypothetical protein